EFAIYFGNVILLLAKPTTSQAHPLSHCRVIRHLFDRRGESIRVFRRHENSGCPVYNCFTATWNVRRYYCPPHCCRFQDTSRSPFAIGREDKNTSPFQRHTHIIN